MPTPSDEATLVAARLRELLADGRKLSLELFAGPYAARLRAVCSNVTVDERALGTVFVTVGWPVSTLITWTPGETQATVHALNVAPERYEPIVIEEGAVPMPSPQLTLALTPDDERNEP